MSSIVEHVMVMHSLGHGLGLSLPMVVFCLFLPFVHFLRGKFAVMVARLCLIDP